MSSHMHAVISIRYAAHDRSDGLDCGNARRHSQNVKGRCLKMALTDGAHHKLDLILNGGFFRDVTARPALYSTMTQK